MFKPGDLVTIGDDKSKVYTAEQSFFKKYIKLRVPGYSHGYAVFDSTTGEHCTGIFPNLKHYDASEPLPPTSLEHATAQVTGGTKATNPKDAIGSDKIPFHLWPSTATVLGSLALLDGALKYGRSNWRVAGVRATVYTDAMERHLNRMKSGEWLDPDSGLPHVAHILACAGILADAKAAGKLNEDWEVQGGLTALIAEMTPHVKRLKELHKDKNPRHYTCTDNEVTDV